MPDSLRLLLVHAHPDDETINTGATMARYAAEGAHVTLVTCTRGEEGDIVVPALARLAADRDGQFGPYRAGELAAAMSALGVVDHRFLGGPGRYRDSGMMGEPTNDRPDAFWRADLDEAAAQLVAVLREVRPQVLVTYDENGGYGHPDHIQAHRVAMRAVPLAADDAFRPELGPGWQVTKVYEAVLPASAVDAGLRRLRSAPTATSVPFTVPADAREVSAVDDARVTAAVDGTAHLARKLAALRAHATQLTVHETPAGPFFALSNDLGQPVLAVEHFRLAASTLAADAATPESDLFAGVGPAPLGRTGERGGDRA